MLFKEKKVQTRRDCLEYLWNSGDKRKRTRRRRTERSTTRGTGMIKESRCNREYERCMTEEIAKYLGRKSRRERKMMVRF
jgi:hypothetical protein